MPRLILDEAASPNTSKPRLVLDAEPSQKPRLVLDTQTELRKAPTEEGISQRIEPSKKAIEAKQYELFTDRMMKQVYGEDELEEIKQGQNRLNKFMRIAWRLPTYAVAGPGAAITFEGLDQARNALYSKVKQEKYDPTERRMLSELLPEDTHPAVRIGASLVEYGGEIALVSKFMNLATEGTLRGALKEVGQKLEKAGYGKGKVTIPEEAIKDAARGTRLEKAIKIWWKARKSKPKIPVEKRISKHPETKAPDFPVMKNTQDAVRVGESIKNNPVKIAEFKALREKMLAEIKDMPVNQEKMDKIVQAQLVREAVETAEGTIADIAKKSVEVKPEPKKPPKLVKEVPAPTGKVTVLPRKKQLLKQIDEAIEKAPEIPASVITPEGAKELKIPAKVTFEIDGGAEIINTKESLGEFRKRIAKTSPTLKPDEVKRKPLKELKFVDYWEKELARAEYEGDEKQIETARAILEQAKRIEAPVEKKKIDISQKNVHTIREGESNYYELSEATGKDLPRSERIQGSISVSPIKVKYKKQGYFKFPSEKVNSPADVAFAFQQLKNEAVERFYVIGLKDGTPVCIEPISIGAISSAHATPFESLHLLLSKKANGFYMIHNHPSGVTELSTNDQQTSNIFAQVYRSHGIKFAGHVIMNHTEFGLQDFNFDVKTLPIPKDSIPSKKVPYYSKYIEWTEGKTPQVKNPKEIVKFTKNLNVDWDKNALVLYLDTQLKIRNSELLPPNKITVQNLSKTAVDSRSTGIILVNSKLPDFEIKDLKKNLRLYPITLIDEITYTTPDSFISRNDEGALLEPQEEFGFADKLSSKQWEMELSQEPETQAKVNKTQIMTFAEKAFKVPIRGRATHKWKAAGMYYPKKMLVRLKKWGELAPMTHEVAHHLDHSLRKSLGRYWKQSFAPKGQKRAMLQELRDLDYYPQRQRTHEGFAEFIRHFLTTDVAQKRAPLFYKYFTENFLKENPEIKNTLSKLRTMLDTWRKQGAENRVLQQIDFKEEHIKTGTIVDKIKEAKDWVLKNFHDEFYLLQKIEDQMGLKVGKNIRPSEDPFTWATYAKSKASIIARTFVMNKAIDEYGNVLGPGLSEILTPIPLKQMKQFISYGVAKRAFNLDRRGIESGLDREDIKFILEKYKNPEWDKVLDNLTKWNNHLLDWVVRAGGLGPEEAEVIRKMNPVYLPFKRAFVDKIVAVKGVGGIANKGQAIKRIKGSGRAILNPIEAMISQATEMIAKAHKIHLAKLIADVAEREGVGGFITKVPAPQGVVTAPLGKVDRDFKSKLAEFKIMLKEIGIDTSEINGDTMLNIFTQKYQYMGKDNIVSIWRNGKREFYELHPDLYKVLNGVDILKRGPLLNFFAPAARLLRLGATTLRISFGLARNPFRDAFTYAVFSKRPNSTVFDPVKGIYKDITAKPGELVWRFKATGGSLAGMIGLDRAATMSTYDDLLTDKLGKSGKVLKIVKHPIDTLRNILSITELGPRSVEMEKNYEMYKKQHPEWTEEDAFMQAFNDAQDVTVNFTRSGYYAKRINEAAAFFNVAIRGPEKLFRSMRERPGTTIAKGVLWISLYAVYNWWRNKDRDWYKNIAPAYKYNNFWFEMGNNVIRLPIPFDLGIAFAATPIAAMDSIYNKNPKYAKALIDLVKAQFPDPTPTLLVPLLDVAKNKNFLGIPIESEGMQGQFPTERKKHYTTKVASALSKGFNQLGITLSPVQIDYLLNSYTGGWARQLPLRPTTEPADIPVLGDMILRMPQRPQRQLNEFYSRFELLSQKNQSKILKGNERGDYTRLKSLERILSVLQKQLIKNYENKRTDKVKKTYDRISEVLSKFGFN